MILKTDKTAPPNYPLRDPKYDQIETIRPSIEVHWGSRRMPAPKIHLPGLEARRSGVTKSGATSAVSLLQSIVAYTSTMPQHDIGNYTYASVYMSTHIYIYVYIHICMYVYIYIYVCICFYMYISMYTHMYVQQRPESWNTDDPKGKEVEGRRTSINHPKSMFQLFGVYCICTYIYI